MGRSGSHRRGRSIRNALVVAGGAAVAVAGAVAVAMAATSGAHPGSASAEAVLPTSTPRPLVSVTTPTLVPSPPGSPTPSPRPTVHRRHKSGPRILQIGTCEASYYEGVPTSSGGTLTAANKTLPFGTRVQVVNEDNGESVVVTVTDRGPFVTGRCLDLSTSAMSRIGGLSSGVVPVKYEVFAS